MTAGSPIQILKGPCRLVLAPTDLTAVYPYGGTVLGFARALEFRWGQRTYTERAEEFGGQPASKLFLGNWAALVCVIRGWDKDTVSIAFPDYVVGASGQATVAGTVNGAVRSGTDVTARKILIVPQDSPTSLPSAIMYAALPNVEAQAAMQMSRRTEGGIAIAAEAGYDDTGRTHQVGLLRDLAV